MTALQDWKCSFLEFGHSDSIPALYFQQLDCQFRIAVSFSITDRHANMDSVSSEWDYGTGWPAWGQSYTELYIWVYPCRKCSKNSHSLSLMDMSHSFSPQCQASRWPAVCSGEWLILDCWPSTILGKSPHCASESLSLDFEGNQVGGLVGECVRVWVRVGKAAAYLKRGGYNFCNKW